MLRALVTRILPALIALLAVALVLGTVGPRMLRAAADGPPDPPPGVLTQDELQSLLSTHDMYYYQTTFEAKDQSLWGPGTEATPDTMQLPLEPNSVHAQLSDGHVVDVAGEKFGADVTLNVDGDFGFNATFHDFGTGNLSVRLPANAWLFVPRKDSFVPGDTVTIETFGAYDRPQMDPEFPKGQIDVTATGDLDVSADIRFCIFDCKHFDSLLPSFNRSLNLPLIPPFDANTGDLTGSLLPPYTIDNQADTKIPFLAEFLSGVGGHYHLPDLSYANSGVSSYFGSSEDFIDLSLDLDKYYSMAVGNKIPLSASNKGFEVATHDISASYTLLDEKEWLKFSLGQSLELHPDPMQVTLRFPQALQYTVRDHATHDVVSTGNSDTITVTVGEDIEFVAPAIDPNFGWSVDPTFQIPGNTFTNTTTISNQRSIHQVAGEFSFDIPKYTVVPAVKVAGHTVTPAVKSPEISESWGPEDDETLDLPATQRTMQHGATGQQWTLQGFNPYAGSPVVLDPRPGGSGDFAAPSTAVQNQGVRFEAFTVPNPGGQELEYWWDFGDGTTVDPTNSDALNRVVDHVYRSSGAYAATLTVKEALTAAIRPADQHTWTSSRTVTVDAVPPRVTEVSYAGPAGAVTLGAGDALQDVHVSQLGLTFSEAMIDSPGDAGASDVTNPGNYLLVRSPGTTVDAASCAPMGTTCATSDQRQVVADCPETDFEGCGVGHADGDFGQSFTAGRTGSLAAISVLLNRAQPDRTYTLKVFQDGIIGDATVGYAPATTPALRSQAVSLHGGWNDLVLAAPLPVTAGSTYTFTVTGGDIYAPDVGNNGHTYVGGRTLANPGFDFLFETWVALPGAQAPFGALGDGARIAVDAVTYDAATQRVTLTVNGGNPLPGGGYRLIARGARGLRDTAGNALDGSADGVGGDDFTRDFSISATAPYVTGVGSSSAGNVEDGASTRAPITDLRVAFDEPMRNPDGDTASGDVTNPANYVLVGAGDDGVISTALCATASPCLVAGQAELVSHTGSIGVVEPHFGEVFHARYSGWLSQVAFDIDSAEGDAATFELYAGAPGPNFVMPGDAPMASQDITLTPGWNIVPIHANLNAGSTYTFRVIGAGSVTAPAQSIDVETSHDHAALFSSGYTQLFKTYYDAAASEPGFGFIGDDAVIAIDGVIYDAATATATLALNGGVALPADQTYRLFVRGFDGVVNADGTAIDGNGDGVPGDDFARTFRVDGTQGPPVVTTLSYGGAGVTGSIHVDPHGGAGGDVLVTDPLSRISVTFNKRVNDPDGDVGLTDATNPEAYRLYGAGFGGGFPAGACAQQVASTVAIDGVTYDDATQTATLSLNGGASLPDGSYRLLVCGSADAPFAIADLNGRRLDGYGNGLSGVADYIRDFALNWQPPAVTGVSELRGAIADGDVVPETHPVASLAVSFSEPMSDPAGDTLPHDVTNPASYALFGAGPDGAVASNACGAPQSDDVAIAVDGVTVSQRGTVATLALNGGAQLPSGVYRLLVCAAQDAAGNPLDGDGDGTAGDAFALDFGSGGDVVAPYVASSTISGFPADPYIGAASTLDVTFSEPMLDRYGDTDAQDVTNPAHYLVVGSGSSDVPQEAECGPLAAGDSAVPIDAVTYDAATTTATLHLNGGWPLPAGGYRLLVCSGDAAGVALIDLAGHPLDGDRDGLPGGDVSRGFQTLNTAPSVVGAAIQGVGPSVDVMDPGATVPDSKHPVHAVVGFSKSVQNPAGDDGAGDISNPANYELLTPGADGTFETPGCGPVQGDDAAIRASLVHVFNSSVGGAAAGANVEFPGYSVLGDALPQGAYRLVVCSGHASVADPAGNVLDGNGDGQQGDDFTRDFIVVDDTAPKVRSVTAVGAGGGGGVLAEGATTATGPATLGVHFSEPVADPAGDTDPYDVTNPGLYRLYAAGPDGVLPYVDCRSDAASIPAGIPVDSVAYDAAGHTALLAVNGGEGLRDGTYRLVVCASDGDGTQPDLPAIKDLVGHRLDGFGNGIAGGADFHRDFAVESGPPTVLDAVTTEAAPDGALFDGSLYPGDQLLTQFTLRFSEWMATTASDPANYALVDDGPDGVAQTAACDAPAGDDLAIPLDALQFDAAAATVSLRANGGVRLPDDAAYRLIACAGVTDSHGAALDGDYDGAAGGGFALDFRIAPNPNMADAELSDLTLTPPADPVLGAPAGSATLTVDAAVTNHGPLDLADFAVTLTPALSRRLRRVGRRDADDRGRRACRRRVRTRARGVRDRVRRAGGIRRLGGGRGRAGRRRRAAGREPCERRGLGERDDHIRGGRRRAHGSHPGAAGRPDRGRLGRHAHGRRDGREPRAVRSSRLRRDALGDAGRRNRVHHQRREPEDAGPHAELRRLRARDGDVPGALRWGRRPRD